VFELFHWRVVDDDDDDVDIKRGKQGRAAYFFLKKKPNSSHD
jgi:predicted RNA-binding protein YlxR (DUF448 family)